MMYHHELKKREKLELLSTMINQNSMLSKEQSLQLVNDIITQESNPVRFYKKVIISLDIR